MFKIIKDNVTPNLKKSGNEEDKKYYQAGKYHYFADEVSRVKDLKDLIDKFEASEKVKFRLIDDDKVVHYYGYITKEDYESENNLGGIQEDVLNWGMAMSGAVIIEVMRDGKYVQEIC
jgi:hypothetical protein